MSLCGPLINWLLVQGVTLSSPFDCWESFQRTLESRWMYDCPMLYYERNVEFSYTQSKCTNGDKSLDLEPCELKSLLK